MLFFNNFACKLQAVLDWIMASNHILIPRNGEFPLYGKRDFADVMKLKILRWEMSLDLLGGPHQRRQKKKESEEKVVSLVMEAEIEVMRFAGGGR